ncbi:DUF2147 domain-containing protein [Frateuria sp. MAH-13]|uniref:DUF2147 domain-containing protein n=1 Tax=Frateuria flava TaxID=2821489 RepID=A0ABS4DRC5_9GAMM|nr:DUF2147 domain-containing protein [Frateuria flava]MBP1475609.1 DUF2147 domain-containing protein [Frateuria flava]
MKQLFRLALAAGLLFGSAAVYAANDTPVGTWKTIDDQTGKAKSIVEITEQNGELQARVLKVLQSDEGPNPTCRKCEGERKDKPVEGMVIMWGVTRDGDKWDGGKILDPHNGKTYKVKLSMLDGGQKLDVHGYIGFALLGRSQVWERQE